MTPYQRSYESYHSIEQDKSWNDFLSYHLNNPHSYVYSSPEFFVVAQEAEHKLMKGLYIHEFAGNMTGGLEVIPECYEFIRYERRDGKVRTRHLKL